MKKNEFAGLLKEKILILDGATGTELHKRGYLEGVCSPEELNLKFPERIKDIHLSYLKAGSDIVIANTFGANRHKLSDYNLQDRLAEINHNAVRIAKEAAKDFGAHVAADIGPVGSYLEPLGPITFDGAYAIFAEQVKVLNEAQPDLIIIETMAEIRELKAALLAAKDNFDGPVIAQMTFGADGSTVTGTSILAFLALFEAMGADGIGLNCSVGPKDLLALAKILTENTSIPISFKPNAGMPKLVNRETVFPGTSAEFVEAGLKAYQAGVNMLGGCCGTTPEFISALAKELKGKKPASRKNKTSFFISSRTTAIDLNEKGKFFVIGERINPTNRKKFQAELSQGVFSTIRKEAKIQVSSGANILDINMGVPGADEPALMKKAVEEIQETVQVPLCLDSSSAAALEAGLKACAGKPIINSVNGDDDKLSVIIPLAKRYGAAIIGLCTDHKGLPKTSAERLTVAKRILEYADKYGYNKAEIIFDFLTLSVSAASDQTVETLQAVKESNTLWPKNKTVLGLSNISFGMPNRQLINSTFLRLAKEAGLNSAILNPHEEWKKYDKFAESLLLGKDIDGKVYIEKHGNVAPKKAAVNSAEMPADKKLYIAVLDGNREEIPAIINEALQKGFAPLVLSNSCILEALNEVGIKFNAKEYFLPQVIRSAEAAQAAFAVIKPLLKKDSSYTAGKILLATVKGDVHDIGKNIVAAVFESHGWDIVDLGKNVETDAIIETAKKENCDIIGLSALMTTTMIEMEKVIKARDASGLKAKVLIGGAPVTEKFAREIGADGYGKDAVKAVEVAEKLK